MEVASSVKPHISQAARYGMISWVAGFVWFFLAQVIVGGAWSHPGYSWQANNVSDLGNIHCQMWAEDGHAAQYTCSPLHSLMNATFILEGAIIIFGVWSIKAIWKKSVGANIARIFLTLSGAGIIVAGLAPADAHENIHVVLGALFIALFGNLGLILSGWVINQERIGKLRFIGPTLGIIGFVGAFLFQSHQYLGLGPGGMERIWGYVVVIWTFIMGSYGFYNNSLQTYLP